MTADARAVIAYQSEVVGSIWDVFVRGYRSNGDPDVAAEVRANTHTSGRQQLPSVAIGADGSFVVAWKSEGQDLSGDGVFAQRFDWGCVPVGAELRVNNYEDGEQSGPSVSMAGDGSFVIAWHSVGLDGSGRGIFLRRFAADGSPLDAEDAQVNTTTAENQESVSIALAADGSLALAWQSQGQDGDGFGIVARRLGPDGGPLGPEILVNAFAQGDQHRPAVASAADGSFVVVWQSDGPQDGSGGGIFAQRFDPTGRALGVGP
jgi:hypothetical protein